jgi:short-subunit dehydrogenase
MSTPTCLVTGASSGIGRSFAEELARRNWRVIAVARDLERLNSVVSSLPGEGHVALAADLSTSNGCDRVEHRLRTNPPIDLLINAAGLGTSVPYPWASLEEEERQIAVNVSAVLRLCHVAADVMARRNRGGIINISSTAAFWSTGTYAASKSWVLDATLGLHHQLRDSGVRVVAVVPGFTRTDFHKRSSTDASGVKPWLWLDTKQVVHESLTALNGRRALCIPSARYRCLVSVVRHLSPSGRRAVLAFLAPLRGSLPKQGES